MGVGDSGWHERWCVGDGGGQNERICCLLMTTNRALGFADTRFVGG